MHEITVNGVTITSSPYPTPKAHKAAWRVVVPELKVTAYFLPNLLAKLLSRRLFILPEVPLAKPESKTSFIYLYSLLSNLHDKSPTAFPPHKILFYLLKYSNLQFLRIINYLTSVVRLTLLYIWRSLTLSVQPMRKCKEVLDAPH